MKGSFQLSPNRKRLYFLESHFILPGLKVPYVRTLVENSQKFTKIVSRILRNDSFDIVMLVFCTAQISQHANQPEKNLKEMIRM